jgi:hypothetical protein
MALLAAPIFSAGGILKLFTRFYNFGGFCCHYAIDKSLWHDLQWVEMAS